MQKVSPCLWFDGEAAEAAAFYVSLFPNSSIVSTTHYSEGSPRPAGSVMTVRFTLDGEEYVALNCQSASKIDQGSACNFDQAMSGVCDGGSGRSCCRSR